MSILVYTRPWNHKQFRHLAQLIWPGEPLIVVSEHRKCDEWGLSEQFYRNLRRGRAGTAALNLLDDEIQDIILRCRLLRSVPQARAMRWVEAMSNAIDHCLDHVRPKAILAVTVDSYVLHLMSILSRSRGIRYIGLVPSFVNGYFRITELGERVAVRHPAAEEVRRVESILASPTYRPAFVPKAAWRIYLRGIHSWLRSYVVPAWGRVTRKLLRDSENFHWLATEITARQNRSALPPVYVPRQWSENVNASLHGSKRPLVFFPLQMSPEATIDYWSKDRRWVNYEAKAVEVVRKNPDITFLIKEHPNVLGFRSHTFYRAMENAGNCVWVPPHMAPSSIFPYCDAAVICTGSIGFEAALRGIPVYSDAAPYYLPETAVLPVASVTKIRPTHCRSSKNALGIHGVCKAERFRLVEYLLESLLPGTFINNGTWNERNEMHVRANVAVAKSLRRALSDGTGK